MKIFVGIVIIIAVAAVTFFSFRFLNTPEGKKVATIPTLTPTQGPPKMQANDEVLLGEITKVNGRHFFLLVGEKTHEIVLSDHSYYKKGKKADLVEGAKIGIIASPDEDGTSIARTIVLNASSSEEVVRK